MPFVAFHDNVNNADLSNQSDIEQNNVFLANENTKTSDDYNSIVNSVSNEF